MKVFENLSKYSWIRIGGFGEVLCPSSVNEFFECYGKGPVVGQGSNVLFFPTTKCIVSTKKLVKIACIGPDRVKAQCGVQNNMLLQFALKHGLGGVEFLSSIPGTIGGAVFMNAGRGEKHKCAIEQRVIEVEYYDGVELQRISRDECSFSHRRSIFHKHPDWLIVSVTLVLLRQMPKKTQEMIQLRKINSLSVQDRSAPNLGTVFSAGYKHQSTFEGIRFGGMQWSTKTPNWMLNVSNGTYKDCIHLINEIQQRHSMNLELEIRIL